MADFFHSLSKNSFLLIKTFNLQLHMFVVQQFSNIESLLVQNKQVSADAVTWE